MHSLTVLHYTPAETKIPLTAFVSAAACRPAVFAEELCARVGAKRCVLGSSARALLAELLKGLKEKDGSGRDEVLIPGYTCYSVAASVASAGLKIAVYDLDPRTFRPDPESLREQAGGRTLAVVAQHLFGIPGLAADMEEVARGLGIVVIDDAAQALGGMLNGKALGTGGDYGLYSFGRGKPLPLGGGGAVVSREGALMDRLVSSRSAKGFATLAQSMLVQALSHPRIYGILEALPLGLGETEFDPSIAPGPMGTMVQNLGSSSLGLLEMLNSHRAAVARVYREHLAERLLVDVAPGVSPVYPRFPVLAGKGVIPGGLKRLGVRRMYPRAIADEPAIRPYLSPSGAYGGEPAAHPRFVRAHTGEPASRTRKGTPGARAIADTLVTLPTHLDITEPLALEIASLVNRFAEGSRKA
jgi:dTDP-4-amino-4,6-dideoxygalactose transaminase